MANEFLACFLLVATSPNRHALVGCHFALDLAVNSRYIMRRKQRAG